MSIKEQEEVMEASGWDILKMEVGSTLDWGIEGMILNNSSA